MDLALKALTIISVDNIYLKKKCDQYTGFLSVTARDLISHLRKRYGKITVSNLIQNKRKMDKTIDPLKPIERYFKRIDDSVQFATDAETAYIPEQILQAGYYAISSSKLYTNACKE